MTDLLSREATFWMVWNKDGGAPSKTHASLAKATKEAKRLARRNPGRKFIVLGAVEKYWTLVPPVPSNLEGDPTP